MESGSVILLDTHVLLWLLLEPKQLSAPAASAIRKSLATGGIAIASITLWELGMMIALGRNHASGHTGSLVDRARRSFRTTSPLIRPTG